MEIQITNKKKPLGSGGCSHVLPGTYKDQNVAVKRIQLLDATEDNEVKVMQQILDHPNIVKLLHVEDDEYFRFIALELCVASLDQIFLDPENPRKYEGPELPNHLEIFSQLASGLEYIHSKKLIHRDIKPANILVHVDSTNQITMKLADFGLSRPVNERGTYTMSSKLKGTKCWYAPELLDLINQFQQSTQRRGTVKSDVFALGLVFAYLLLDGRHLYGTNENEINANIVADTQVNINKIHPFHYALELIKNMLKHDDRISSGEVVIQLKSIKQKLAVKEQELRHLCTKKSLDFEKFKSLIRFGIDVKSIGGSNELDKAFQVILDQLVEETKKFENDPNYPSNYRRKMSDIWNNFIYTLSNFPQTFQDEIVQLCAKNIIDSLAKLSGGLLSRGVAKAAAGSSIVIVIGMAIVAICVACALVNPIIIVIGLVIGAVVVGVELATTATRLSNWLTQKISTSSKDVDVENAHKILGLENGASNEEIISNFRRLALKYHPDKGGSYDDWQKLQVSLAVIKMTKGEI